jgi:hypothetical protein
VMVASFIGLPERIILIPRSLRIGNRK